MRLPLLSGTGAHMGKGKMNRFDRGRIIMGAAQIALITSLGLYILCALSYSVILLCTIPVVIGAVAGVAVIGRSGKEVLLKWTLSIPMWLIAATAAVKSQVNVRLVLQLTGYDDMTVGEGLEFMLAILFVGFWSLVFMGAGDWFSCHEKFRARHRIVFIIQAVPINIICVGVIAVLIALNFVLPAYRAGMHYT